MRKITVLTILSVMMLLALTGCKKKSSYKDPQPSNMMLFITESKDSSSQSGDDDNWNHDSTSTEEQAESNFSDHDTLEAAIEESGIDLALPGSVKGFHESLYSNVGQTYIEVIYTSDNPVDEEAEELTYNTVIIRKEPSNNAVNISGTDTAYQTSSVMELNGVNVTLKSQDGLGYVAIWYTDGASYAVVSHYGVDVQEMQTIISDVIEVNR